MKLRLFIVLAMLSAVILYLSPIIDSQWAIIPYDVISHKFYGETHLWCQIIYYSVNVATVLLAILPLVIFIYMKKNHPHRSKNYKRMLLISYLSLAIGPGLVVNTVFKENWGRARPYQVIRDHHQFSLPWQPHFNRPTDNSFPSGHVSIGAFIGIPFIALGRRRLGIALCAGGFVAVGLVRFLQGGHYPTDIAMAALIVWMINLLITHLVDRFFLYRKH